MKFIAARPRRVAAASLSIAAAAVLLAAPAVQAQYKVIGADGKVTYTDREPTASDGRASGVGARAPTQQTETNLPFELRQVAAKYPVTLYTTGGACEPCVQARQFLKQRGVPFGERQATSDEDLEALEKISGAREAPTLRVGTQVLRGFASDTWTQYLDAAGYPRTSQLPSTYQYRAAVPIVDRPAPAPAVARSEGASPALPGANPSPPAAAPAGAGGIRF